MMDPLNWLYLKGKHFVGAVIINICHIDTYVRIKLKGKKIIMTALKTFFIMMKELKQKSNKILLLKNNPASSVNVQDLLYIISEQISWSQGLRETTVFVLYI